MDKCTICGNPQYDFFHFKGGHVCEDCLDYIRAELDEDHLVGTQNN